jgi:hypothetical protein
VTRDGGSFWQARDVWLLGHNEAAAGAKSMAENEVDALIDAGTTALEFQMARRDPVAVAADIVRGVSLYARHGYTLNQEGAANTLSRSLSGRDQSGPGLSAHGGDADVRSQQRGFQRHGGSGATGR